MQVDLGLAAAGDAGEEKGVELAEGGIHGVVGGALFGVERQLGLGQPVLVARRGGAAACLDVDQALFLQQVEAVLVQLQLAKQLVGDAVGVLGEGGQCLSLARCAGQARVVGAGAFADMPEALLARFGRLALAQQHGQGPAEGVAEAVLVVLGGPQAELEQLGGQRRFLVEQFQGRAQFVFGDIAVLGHFHQDADYLATAEGHAQAHAGLQLPGRYASGRAVVEQAAQGRGQGKAQDGVGHGGLRMGAAILARPHVARRGGRLA